MLALLIALVLAADPVEGDPEAPEVEADDELVITVIGGSARALAGVPGAATVVTAEDLAAMQPVHGGEVLQTVPGVTVTDEDGFGLRQNIGIRGLNPNRSRKVLVLEDGAPVALAPYGEPELYWSPTIERMKRVEIVKGSGAILFGPQTIGGVINYVTPDPPEAFSVSLAAKGGSYGLMDGRAEIGGTVGTVGLLASALVQRFPGPRVLGLERADGNLKLVWRPVGDHALVAKVGVYGEQSKATYLGLTTPQFHTDPRLSLATNDWFTVRRIGGSLTHTWFATDHAVVRTLAYAHTVDRDWRRQDFDRSDEGRDYERVFDGAGVDVTATPAAWPVDGSGVFFRDSASRRDRLFHVAGVQSEAQVGFAVGALRGELRAGARVHVEHTSEQRVEGDAPDAVDEVVSDSTRWARAFAAWAQQRLVLLDDRLEVTPGLRLEALSTSMRVHRWRLPTEAGTLPVDFDPPLRTDDTYVVALPGLGIAGRVADSLTVFAGAHRGFAPPRTKDAVTTDGDPIDLAPESSWNLEVGGRHTGSWSHVEVAGFVLDFANQVVEPSEAGGAVSAALVNGGRTLHAGVESAARVDPLAAVGAPSSLPLSVAYTFTHARFGDGWGLALLGQPLPYAPAHTLVATAGFAVPQGIAGQVKATHVGRQFADTVATVAPSLDGLVGELPARTVLDARLAYTHAASGIEVSVSAKNVLDTVYIASRSPRGIQPGAPRLILGGITWRTPAR